MYTCPQCSFETASQRGFHVHMSRMHKQPVEPIVVGTDSGYGWPPPEMPVRPKVKKAYCRHVIGEDQGVRFTELGSDFTVELCPECAQRIK